ncbi:RNA polymerase sigma factor [Candidatus Poribacteria bacterium]|nr:RNA polymerase sigma factor [Candidatus Poribacteria bacterium]
MSQEPTDQELVIRLKAGDLTALAALDRRYRLRIIRLIAPLAKSYEEAEDIYQEAIFKAASHIECFDHRRSFHNWLHQIAKNQCIDHYRRNGQMERVADDGLLLKLEGKGRDPLEQVAERELHEKVRRAIDALPKRQRSIARLRFLEGLEYKEIAQRVGGSVHAVKSLFSVARKTLKAQLQCYLGCLVCPLRILKRGAKGVEASSCTAMSVSGALSLVVHLAIVALLCYFPIGPSDTTNAVESKGTSVAFIANSAVRRPSLRAVNGHRSNLPSKKWVIPRSVSHSALLTANLAKPHRASLTFLSGQSQLPRLLRSEIPQPVAALLDKAALETSALNSPLIEGVERLERKGSRLEDYPAPGPFTFSNFRSLFVSERDWEQEGKGLESSLPTFHPSNPPFQPSISVLPSTQAELSAISVSFRRLRAFRRAQQMDAYSLAQLRRIARTQGQYPLLISHCSRAHLRALLTNGWRPIVALRSPVGGKHLWVMTDWDTDAAQITLTNPLEGHEIQLSEGDFMEGWETGNAPATCLLLSEQPFPTSLGSKPIPPNDSPIVAENRIRVWY